MKKIYILSTIGLLLAATALSVSFPNPIQASTIPGVINAIINFILIISVPLLSGAVIYGGLLMITSGGDPAKFSSGYKTILYAIFGFIIILLAKGIGLVIEDALGG